MENVTTEARARQLGQARMVVSCNGCRKPVEECSCAWSTPKAPDLRDIASVPSGDPSGYMCECEEAGCVDDDHRLVPITGPAPLTPTLRASLIDFIAGKIAGLPGALALRGVSTTIAAQNIEVDRTTLHKWGTGSMNFRGAAKLRLTTEQLERLACLLVMPSPSPPLLPESMRLRIVTAQLMRLEMSATHDRILELETWAQRWLGSKVRISCNTVRLSIEGPHEVVRRMRQELLAAERWRTLTPSPDDLLRWMRGDLRLIGGAA